MILRLKTLLARAGYFSKPDFLIIGAQRAGTTALFSILNQHSSIVGSKEKEIHYFDNDDWYAQKRLYQYHAYFPLPFNTPENAKLFEATPIYMFHPQAARRLYSYNPGLKFIILLREPAERAFSAWTMYHHHFKSGSFKHLHDPRSFSNAISEEMQHLNDNTFYEDRKGYVRRGIYVRQINQFLTFFKKDQMLFVENNHLRSNFPEEIRKILNFVGVPYEKLSWTEVNQSQVVEKEKYRHDIDRLRDFYAAYNKELYELIGAEFNWNNSHNK